MKVSKYITLSEAIKSQTAERYGIANIPGDEALQNMKRVGTLCFDPVREYVGGPLYVSSFFRSPELNVRIGGSPTSDHVHGHAIDIDADVYNGKTNKEVFDFIRENLEFDQLIWEFGSVVNPAWVHVSLRPTGNRRQVLRALRDKSGNVVYKPFDLI